MFPLKTAIHFPVLLFGKVDCSMNRRGAIVLQNGVKFGLLRIGYNFCRVHGLKTNYKSRLSIEGRLVLHSRPVTIGNGSILVVERQGIVDLGGGSFGPLNKIYCRRSIRIDEGVLVSWQCQFIDTDFHFLIDEKGYVYANTKGITLGRDCWIGNNVIISKGTILPSYSTVSQYSLVNKDMTEFGENSVFAGIPAARRKSSMKRVFDNKSEQNLCDFFEEHPNEDAMLFD